MLKQIVAADLSVAYEEAGPVDGQAVLLLHGFPYDVRAFDSVVPTLVCAGCRVVVPYLRGFGATRFLSASTLRSGQQAVLAHDLLALMDALRIPSAVLAGYDWGGRAACIVAALWPERVVGLVSGDGYNIQNIAQSASPQAPDTEFRLWYQYYLHGKRGQEGLERNRYDFCRLLWRLWSPNWQFDEATFERTAASFDNPDFVDVVIHSYRHRFALVEGDPQVEATERRLADQPKISVPAIVIDGASDGVIGPGGSEKHAPFFTGFYGRRTVPRVGHNLPQEAPAVFAAAVLALV